MPEVISPIEVNWLSLVVQFPPSSNSGPTNVPGLYPALTAPQYAYQIPAVGGVTGGVTAGGGVTGGGGGVTGGVTGGVPQSAAATVDPPASVPTAQFQGVPLTYSPMLIKEAFAAAQVMSAQK